MFDLEAFTSFLHEQATGQPLPGDMATAGRAVRTNPAHLRPGDGLLLDGEPARALYIGQGKALHSTPKGAAIVISPLDQLGRIGAARRYL